MRERVWEWVIDRGAGNSPAGVSGTRHGAMGALSRTLVTADAPASGRVVPIALVDGAWGFSYLRMTPVLRADYEMGVIKWHRTSK